MLEKEVLTAFTEDFVVSQKNLSGNRGGRRWSLTTKDARQSQWWNMDIAGSTAISSKQGPPHGDKEEKKKEQNTSWTITVQYSQCSGPGLMLIAIRLSGNGFYSNTKRWAMSLFSPHCYQNNHSEKEKWALQPCQCIQRVPVCIPKRRAMLWRGTVRPI